MNTKRFYYIMLGLFVVGIVAIGATVYFGIGFLQKSSDKLVEAKLENQVVEEREKLYLKAKKDLATYQDLGNTIAKVLPQDKDQARAVQELYRIGDETGIDIVGITFPASTLGTKARPVAGSSSTASTPSTTTTSSSAAQSTVTQAKPVEGIKGVQGIDINLTLEPVRGETVSYQQMLNFLNKIQQNRRNMQITQVSVQPDVKNGGLTFSLSLRIFVKS